MAETQAKQEAATRPAARKKPKEDFIQEALFIIGNAKADPEIAAAIAEFGYDAAKLDEGEALIARLVELASSQRAEYGQRYDATQATSETWKKAEEAYGRALKVARIALRDRRGARSAMMVDGPRNKSLTGWLHQAEAFYAGLFKDPEALAEMSRFRYTPQSLQRDQALLAELSRTATMALKEKGEAFDSTRERDRKLDEVARWISDLRSICKLALKDSPGKLRALGIS